MTILFCKALLRGLFVGGMASLAWSAAAPAAPACTAQSGAALVPLVELYTSEGCSSCPPADRWLSARFPPARAGATAATLAFHVDYWDRLGWKDRFALPQYTERQYATMRAGRGTFVYTPQVVIQGRDVPSWRGGDPDARLAAARKQPPGAMLAIDIARAFDGALAVRVDANVAPQRPEAALWIAVTQSGLASDVKAGENQGERLAHDHVVRALHGPFAFDAQGAARATINQGPWAERGGMTAVVAFVQNRRTAEVLQTLTLPVCAGT
jgi:hypothetical protein